MKHLPVIAGILLGLLFIMSSLLALFLVWNDRHVWLALVCRTAKP